MHPFFRGWMMSYFTNWDPVFWVDFRDDSRKKSEVALSKWNLRQVSCVKESLQACRDNGQRLEGVVKASWITANMDEIAQTPHRNNRYHTEDMIHFFMIWYTKAWYYFTWHDMMCAMTLYSVTWHGNNKDIDKLIYQGEWFTHCVSQLSTSPSSLRWWWLL